MVSLNEFTHTHPSAVWVHHYFLLGSKNWHSTDSKLFKWMTYNYVGLHLACSTHGSSVSGHSPISIPQWKQITWSPRPEEDRQVCNLWQVLENNSSNFENKNKYLSRYLNTKTYQRRKSQLHSILEVSALNIGTTFEDSVVGLNKYNNDDILEGPSAKSYAIFLSCTDCLAQADKCSTYSPSWCLPDTFPSRPMLCPTLSIA